MPLLDPPLDPALDPDAIVEVMWPADAESAARQIVALHEAGHAVAVFALGGLVSSLEVTPCGAAGPCSNQMPVTASLLDHMTVAVAGWAAEDLFGTPLGRASRPRVAGPDRLPEGRSDTTVVDDLFELLSSVAPAELAVSDADKPTFVSLAYEKATAILRREQAAVGGLAFLLVRGMSVSADRVTEVMHWNGPVRGSYAERVRPAFFTAGHVAEPPPALVAA